jgi:CubicO group peptidase (beta-lactamase class C family)
MKKLLILVFAFYFVLYLASCLPDDKIKTELNIEPAALFDGWEISTPGSEGFDESALLEAYKLFFSENDYTTGISLLVVRNNKLVAEGYCRDINDRDVKRNIQSATKSFTSLVFGIAWDMGFFNDLDQKLYSIIPQEFDSNIRKQEINLRHLMTMKSGLEFSNDDFAQEMHINKQKNQLKYILAKPLYADPGTMYWYRDCDPQLLGGAIFAQTGKTLDQIAEEKLFAPLGIHDYFWEKNADNHNWAAQALYMRPRDMARIGLLVLNNGVWLGQQLVSQEWINLSTSFQTTIESSGKAQTPTDNPNYGYYWWIYEPEYQYLPQVRAVSAVGAGGQYIFLVPEKDLLIVMTSEPYPDGNVSLEWEFFTLATIIINSIIQ